MKLKYNELEFEATTGYVTALEQLLRETLKMMREADTKYKDCWQWGEAVICDLAEGKSIEFAFGGNDSKPKEMSGEVRVRVRPSS